LRPAVVHHEGGLDVQEVCRWARCPVEAPGASQSRRRSADSGAGIGLDGAEFLRHAALRDCWPAFAPAAGR
jgi:hypothetical protein